ncbi:MAG: LysM peptidoglycan-binding domain-containing protein [Spirochaetaceae bacterium]|nr:MAG: LysM peptidoglycan-binding domain-containing protein [Spirochaetaceae bacterium]
MQCRWLSKESPAKSQTSRVTTLHFSPIIPNIDNSMNSRLVCIIALALVFSHSIGADELYHVVETGQTLFSISRRYEVPVEALKDANNITDPTRIRVGMRLRIPGLYEVKAGDTLYGIARSHSTSVTELRSLNNLEEGDILRIGRVLYVPFTGNSGAPDSTSATGTASTPSRSSDTGPASSSDSSSVSSGASTADSGGATRPTVASTTVIDAEGYWPHPGSRERLDGKFRGVAISGTPGDPVQAVASGRVVYAGPHSTFGQVVFVQSATGYIYVYGGNERVQVSVGEMVRAGNEIATLGRAPAEESSRLYFSVWKNNSFIDPTTAPRG